MEFLTIAEFLHKNKNDNEDATIVSFWIIHLLNKESHLLMLS